MKKYMQFFFNFSSIFRKKSTPNCRKTTNNGFVRKNRQRIHVWNAFFHQRVDFQSILGVPLGPQGPPETSGSLPEAFMFFINFQLCLKIGPDRLPGGPRKAPDVPQAPPGHNFGFILDRFFGSICPHGSGLVFWTLRWFRGTRQHTRRLMGISRSSLGGCPEIAGNFNSMCPLMLVLSTCASYVMGKTWETLVISGATMHEGFSYRAICTMEL